MRGLVGFERIGDFALSKWRRGGVREDSEQRRDRTQVLPGRMMVRATR